MAINAASSGASPTTSFTMNSLVGTDCEGNDIVSMNDQWYVLNEQLYRQVLEETRADRFHELIRLIRLSRQVALEANDVKVHYCEGSLPFLLLESPAAIKSLHADLASRPGVIGQQDDGNTAQCYRQRLPIQRLSGYCLFPLIITTNPPGGILGTPLLNHELDHLRHTLSERYGESCLRETFWNMELQPYIAGRFLEFSRSLIASYLAEEWEACGQNYTDSQRQEAFTQVYIPLVLDKISTMIDWWLCDLRKYLNFGRYTDTVTHELREVLGRLGYSDTNASYPMDPERWRQITEITLKKAHALWRRQHGSFLASYKEVLES